MHIYLVYSYNPFKRHSRLFSVRSSARAVRRAARNIISLELSIMRLYSVEYISAIVSVRHYPADFIVLGVLSFASLRQSSYRFWLGMRRSFRSACLSEPWTMSSCMERALCLLGMCMWPNLTKRSPPSESYTDVCVCVLWMCQLVRRFCSCPIRAIEKVSLRLKCDLFHTTHQFSILLTSLFSSSALMWLVYPCIRPFALATEPKKAISSEFIILANVHNIYPGLCVCVQEWSYIAVLISIHMQKS